MRIVKIGGHVIDNVTQLNQFLSDFARMKGLKILVHGGGRRASELSRLIGLTPQFQDGRRITSEQDLEIVTMVYAGLINKNITARLQSLQCNAMGLSGADNNCILSNKRPVHPVDFGWVGDIKSVNAKAVQAFLMQSITPVFCAITHDGNGQLLNTNADTIAAELAIGLSAYYETELIYCFEKRGVLENMQDENSVLLRIDRDKFNALKKENLIQEGMLPKMHNCFDALEKNVSKVIIGNIGVINGKSKLFTTITL